MYQSERLEKILAILQKSGYVTVHRLTRELDYSTATVNRDLNLLEAKHLIKRSYGGVTLAEGKEPPLVDRYRHMEKVKNGLCETAMRLISDGDVLFIDGSTTTEALGKYLLEKRDLTVITNNLALFLFLSQNGVNAVSLGGRICELPYLLGGNETEGNAMRYRADKVFFSAAAITEDGQISADEEYETLRRIMMANSREVYFMADHEKVGKPFRKMLTDLSAVTGIICDYDFSKETRSRYPNTRFLT